MYHTKLSILSLTIVGLNIFGVLASPSETVDPDTKVNLRKKNLFPAFTVPLLWSIDHKRRTVLF